MLKKGALLLVDFTQEKESEPVRIKLQNTFGRQGVILHYFLMTRSGVGGQPLKLIGRRVEPLEVLDRRGAGVGEVVGMVDEGVSDRADDLPLLVKRLDHESSERLADHENRDARKNRQSRR